MIIGSGVDVLETGRLERELARASWNATHGIFRPSEIQYCTHSKRPAPLFAGCFAAKEAALKALGLEVTSLADFRDIEVTPNPNGNWSLQLLGRALTASREMGARRISVAVAAGRKLSGAVVVLET